MMILQSHSKKPWKLVLRVAVIAMMGLFGLAPHANAASSPQVLAPSGAVQVFTSADDASPVIEAVSDGKSLSPIAEMTGAGGLKWFMVRTKNGNVGWIKASDNAGAAKIDEHFRTLPKDAVSITATTAAPSSSTTHATGAISIPVKIYGPQVFVPVHFQNGSSRAAVYLLLDTGASQTMISKRVATELRLFSVDSQMRSGTTGSMVADVGVVDVVRVGSVGLSSMRVTIHDLPAAFRSEGLLGFDFLGRFQMSIDSDKQVLVLTPRGK
jgi:hypothetical protein